MLAEGKRRRMRGKDGRYNHRIDVTAFCEDSDTPIVELKITIADEVHEFYLTDSDAKDLSYMVSKALWHLPTSK